MWPVLSPSIDSQVPRVSIQRDRPRRSRVTFFWQRQSQNRLISAREKRDPPFEEGWPGSGRTNIGPRILLRPILENTVYHILLDSLFTRLSNSCGILAACQVRGENHSHGFSASKGNKPADYPEGARLTAFLQRRQKGAPGGAAGTLPITPKNKKNEHFSRQASHENLRRMFPSKDLF